MLAAYIFCIVGGIIILLQLIPALILLYCFIRAFGKKKGDK
jgi:hypothetical protein